MTKRIFQFPSRLRKAGPDQSPAPRVGLAGRLARIAPAVLAVGIMASCGKDLFEPRVDTPYVLTSVNSQALPVTLSKDASFEQQLVADTIRFVGSDRYERVRAFNTIDLDTGVRQASTQNSAGVVIRDGGSFRLVDDICADERSLALCIEPDRARMDGLTLILEGSIPPAGQKVFGIR